MEPKPLAALAGFCFGALAIFGAVLQGALTDHPATIAFALLLMIPYLYLQFKQGMAESEPDTEPA